ncbi:MAG: hypothetical protein JWO82_1854 [Akkermansiaceae bacterium]|nr:hypothetical protein [Akkermansiaceae bacterium]
MPPLEARLPFMVRTGGGGFSAGSSPSFTTSR